MYVTVLSVNVDGVFGLPAGSVTLPPASASTMSPPLLMPVTVTTYAGPVPLMLTIGVVVKLGRCR